MAHIRVSPRHLGMLNSPEFCKRCFKGLIDLRFQPPFAFPMPGLMHNMDRFEKKIVQAHLAEHDELPKWLSGLGCSGTVEFPEKMTIDFPEYDLTLVGKLDEVFLNAAGRLYLVDYKTARCKGEEDEFMPTYQTQLLGYTWLLERNNIGTVDSAALVYFENKLKDYEETPLDLLTEEGFTVPFGIKIHEVEIDRDKLPPLLKRFREIADLQAPPEGNADCENCGKMQRLLDAEVKFRNQEDYERQRDGLARKFSRKLEADRQRARAGWTEDDVLRHEDEDWMFDCPYGDGDLE